LIFLFDLICISITIYFQCKYKINKSNKKYKVMKIMLIVFGAVIFGYLLIRTIVFFVEDSVDLKDEANRCVAVLRDLITMSETDPLAKELVDKFKLTEFDFQDSNSFADDESLAKYLSKLSKLINSMFVCSHYANKESSAYDLLYRERSCRKCGRQCKFCDYHTAKLADYYEKYYKGLEDFDMH